MTLASEAFYPPTWFEPFKHILGLLTFPWLVLCRRCPWCHVFWSLGDDQSFILWAVSRLPFSLPSPSQKSGSQHKASIQTNKADNKDTASGTSIPKYLPVHTPDTCQPGCCTPFPSKILQRERLLPHCLLSHITYVPILMGMIFFFSFFFFL